ncbi:MAG: threonylcarbamoyl-AMP synthase [Dehalococcoidia bacterium]|nr:threonylcarbamoyl-AMP synthase [Dehalococcoidia bacterium]
MLSQEVDPTAQQIQQALSVLRGGGLVAYPTDTVYGLGCDACNPAAIARVFAVKQRPLSQPLPLLVADLAMLEQAAADLSPLARRLIERFMPGPLTIVVRRSSLIPDIVAAGGPSIGLRIPDHPIPRALAAGLGHPIAGTSANRSGMPSARTAAEVRRQLGGAVDCTLDAPCGPSRNLAASASSSGTPESTILDLTQDPPALLRPGPIPLADLQEALGHSLAVRPA